MGVPLINSRNAFTMIEVMLVLVVIGVLGAVAAPHFLDYRHETRHAAAAEIENNLASAIKLQTKNTIVRCSNGLMSNPPIEAVRANDVTVGTGCSPDFVPLEDRKFLATNSSYPPRNPVNGLNTIGQASGVAEDRNFYSGTCSSEAGGEQFGWCYNPYTGSVWASTNEIATSNPGAAPLVTSSSSSVAEGALVVESSSSSSSSSSSVSSSSSSVSSASSSSASSNSSNSSDSSSSLSSSSSSSSSSSVSSASSSSASNASSSSSSSNGINGVVVGDDDDGNNGHGNDDDHCDESNPGNGGNCSSSSASASSSSSESVVGNVDSINNLFGSGCAVAYLSVNGGGNSMNLTSMGMIYSNGVATSTIWRIRNPTNSSMIVRLRSAGGVTVVDNMTVANNTDVYVKSSVVSNATHISEQLNIVDGVLVSIIRSVTKAAGTQTFSSDSTATCAAAVN